jgi:hypothetical protein
LVTVLPPVPNLQRPWPRQATASLFRLFSDFSTPALPGLFSSSSLFRRLEFYCALRHVDGVSFFGLTTCASHNDEPQRQWQPLGQWHGLAHWFADPKADSLSQRVLLFGGLLHLLRRVHHSRFTVSRNGGVVQLGIPLLPLCFAETPVCHDASF